MPALTQRDLVLGEQINCPGMQIGLQALDVAGKRLAQRAGFGQLGAGPTFLGTDGGWITTVAVLATPA